MPASAAAAVQQGFTLLELMVVLGILALMSVVVVPNLTLTENSSFNAEVRKAAGTLNQVRRLAIVQARPAVAELSGSERVQLAFEDEFARGALPTEQVELVFYPQGGSSGGTLHFAQNQRSARIRVNPVTGRIAIAWQDEDFGDEH